MKPTLEQKEKKWDTTYHRNSMDQEELSRAFLGLVKIMDELREGCPWDRKQTFQSLRSLTIEETFELADEIIKEDFRGIKEELGDVLLHIIFYSRIGSEGNHFNLLEVIEGVSTKLVNRHPHIYGDVKVENEEDVKKNWEKIKQKEKKTGLLAGVPRSLPAMIKALRLQEKTAQVGFEWDHIDQVKAKVDEEMNELQTNLQNNCAIEEIEDEYGDLLFALINYARFLKIDPETALEKTNRKFIRRFEYIERLAKRPLTEMSLQEMDQLWEQAKQNE